MEKLQRCRSIPQRRQVRAAKRSGNILTKAGITAQTMAQNPNFWMSFARSYGMDYENAKAEGASDGVAALGATLTSLINAGVEVGIDGQSGIQGLTQDVVNGDTNKLYRWLTSAVEEGQEEAVQGIISRSISKMMYGSEENPIDPKTIVTEAGMGAAAGLILGGGNVLLDTAVQGTTNGSKVVSARQLDAEARAKEYKNAPVNKSILSLIDKVKQAIHKDSESVSLGFVSDATAKKYKTLPVSMCLAGR